MTKAKTMDAIELLKSQHRDVEDLFDRFEKAKGGSAKRHLFEQIADQLAIHASIEEHQFYPAVKAKETEDILLESLEEHLGVKRVIADLLRTTATDETFEAKVTVLREQVEHHVKEEESELFPKVKKLMEKAELENLAAAMQDEADTLEKEGTPRAAVPQEIEKAAPLR